MTEMTGTSYGRRGDDSTQDDEYYDETYEQVRTVVKVAFSAKIRHQRAAYNLTVVGFAWQDLSGFVAEGQEGDGSTQPPRRSSRHSRSGRPRSKHRHKLPDDIPEVSRRACACPVAVSATPSRSNYSLLTGRLLLSVGSV